MDNSLTFPPLVAPLFVPADRPDRFAKAAATQADAVIIDLEDAVDPSAKAGARANLAAVGSLAKPVLVRVNGLDTEFAAADLESLADVSSVGLMIPKAEDPRLVQAAIEKVCAGGATILLIESALGLERVRELAAIPGVSQLAFGPADFCRDLGCSDDILSLLYARSRLVTASRAAGISLPIDGPSFKIADIDALRGAAAHSKALGFSGMLCVHPSQVAAARQAFAPSREQIAWARGVLSRAEGVGAAIHDGEMVDRPIIARARAIVAGAELA